MNYCALLFACVIFIVICCFFILSHMHSMALCGVSAWKTKAWTFIRIGLRQPLCIVHFAGLNVNVSVCDREMVQSGDISSTFPCNTDTDITHISCHVHCQSSRVHVSSFHPLSHMHSTPAETLYNNANVHNTKCQRKVAILLWTPVHEWRKTLYVKLSDSDFTLILPELIWSIEPFRLLLSICNKKTFLFSFSHIFSMKEKIKMGTRRLAKQYNTIT